MVSAEFQPQTTFLNTAALGLPPARTVEALRAALTGWAAGQGDPLGYETAVTRSRESFARIVGCATERVAIGSHTSVMVGLIAASLPPGAEVVLAEGEFSSLVQPFAGRPDLSVRIVPLERVAQAIGPDTALVAVSAVQSADGRIADLPAIRAAAQRHGARTLIDGTQTLGWFPLAADDWDFVVCSAYKWLLCPRGVGFLTVRAEVAETVPEIFAGWYAGENVWESCYGPVTLASSARRFDVSPAWLPFVGAAESLGLIEQIGPEAIGAHDVALAERFRKGVESLGYPAVPLLEGVACGSAIVSVPGLAGAVPALAEAGVRVSSRAGGLRLSFHLYNTAADVDRALDVLSGT